METYTLQSIYWPPNNTEGKTQNVRNKAYSSLTKSLLVGGARALACKYLLQNEAYLLIFLQLSCRHMKLHVNLNKIMDLTFSAALLCNRGSEISAWIEGGSSPPEVINHNDHTLGWQSETLFQLLQQRYTSWWGNPWWAEYTWQYLLENT